MSKNILVIGSLNMDMVINVDHMPAAGETIMGNGLSYIPGGKGANQAYAAGKLGDSVAMLGTVGEDGFGDALIETLNLAGVSTKDILRVNSESTGTAVIYVNKTGNNSIVVIAGANSCCDVKYLQAHDEMLQWADFIILQMEIPMDAISYAVKRANELSKQVVLNPAPAPAGGIACDVLKGITYITPNETELKILSGENTDTDEGVERGAKKLREMGVDNVLVTIGSRGAALIDDNGFCIYPGRKVDAVDTTAAGDCFNAAFVVGLSEGMSKTEAITFANFASSISVTRKGATTSIPERSEVETIRSNKG